MITEDYVSLESAKLLREKGFDERCEYVYRTPDENMIYALEKFFKPIKNSELIDEVYTAPTLSITMKWLREVYNYHICICLDSYIEEYDNQYYIVIRQRQDKLDIVSPVEQVFFNTYEEAAEAAIKYCLENLI